ncbi:MAG: hypothetical protein OXB84_07125 [Halobacteriovoraceae bacterium]|nr:hypothetical protein [Halobacteriovoraceae bacterium]
MSSKAVLVYELKEIIRRHYVLEQKIYAIGSDKRFPDGIKYRLVLIDSRTGNKVLMDNHHPKGHHVHLGEVQIPYEYKDEIKLIEDFKQFVFQHMGVKL